MKNKIKILFKSFFVVFLFAGAIAGISYGLLNNKNKKVLSSVLSISSNPDEQQELKVLIIESNPLLYSITDTSLYPNNNGHPKISEYYSSEDPETSKNKLIQDIEESSHGYLKVNVVDYVWLNEFPTYATNSVLLNNGTYSNKLDEETFLRYSRIPGTNSGSLGDFIKSDYFHSIENTGNFDYGYIIDKYDLINRRKNKEFDQVWIFGNSPQNSYETAMIGKNPYWINGTGIDTYVNSNGQSVQIDCDNFIIAGFDISNPGGNAFHSFGHSVEAIMKRVMGEPTSQSLPLVAPPDENGIYSMNVYNINSKQAYNQLNLWEKFTLNNWNNKNINYTGVGATHFPFNASYNYDYYVDSNSELNIQTYTNWREWLNYPNVTGDNFVLDDASAWLNYDLNSSIVETQSENDLDVQRLYQRFWFSLMPHIPGYTSDGYYNNWWKYWYSLDYVTDIENILPSNQITVEQNKTILVNYSINYYSGVLESMAIIPQGDNIIISNKNVLGFRNGKLYAKGTGTSDVTLYRDGHSLTYSVTVTPSSLTGWQKMDGDWYYFDNNGELLTGWQQINNDLYYFRTEIDEISTGAIASMVKGLATIDGKTYYFRNSTNDIEEGSEGAALINKCAIINNNNYCFDENGVSIDATGISINKSSISLDIGDSQTLVATVSPNNATIKTVSWSSNNTSVATVDSNGKVTAVSQGTATITATTHNGKKSTCELTVNGNEIPIIKSNDSSLSSLVPNVGGLDPEFTSNNKEYSMSIDFRTVRSVNFDAIKNHPLANVESTECIIPNSTTVENIVCNINVIAEDLSITTYHITINNSSYVEETVVQDPIRVNNITNNVNAVLKPTFNQDNHLYEMKLNFANYERVKFEVDTERSVAVSGTNCIIPSSLNVESVTCDIKLTKGNQTANYKIVIKNTNKPNNNCNLIITSKKYNIDESSVTIKVPATADEETIKSNLNSSCGEIRVLENKVVITDGNASKEYKLDKIVVLQTGKRIIKYKYIIITVLSIIVIGLIIIYILKNKKSI